MSFFTSVKESVIRFNSFLQFNECLHFCRVQDVNDVLTAIDHIIEMGLANPSKIAVIGLSHGGFLTTHLIGQVGGYEK